MTMSTEKCVGAATKTYTTQMDADKTCDNRWFR